MSAPAQDGPQDRCSDVSGPGDFQDPGASRSGAPRILVAGVGNIFLGDDGFGVEVVGRLRRRPLPGGVHVMDVGIRGLDLVYALLEGYNALILVDAVKRGAPSGTVYVIEPDRTMDGEGGALGSHDLHPHRALALAAAWGARVPPARLVGCEPLRLGPGIGLSRPVRRAVGPAVERVQSLIVEARAACRSEPCTNWA